LTESERELMELEDVAIRLVRTGFAYLDIDLKREGNEPDDKMLIIQAIYLQEKEVRVGMFIDLIWGMARDLNLVSNEYNEGFQ